MAKTETPGQLQARKLHQHLKRRIREAGRGSVTRVEEGVGKWPGWLRTRRHANRIELSQLLDVLHLLDVDPARFFFEALDGSHAGADELARLGYDAPGGNVPEIVRRALARIADGDSRRGTAFAGEHANDLAARFGEVYLESLDARRYENPREAVALATRAAEHVDVAHLAALLGVAASAFRLWEVRLREAEHCVRAGLAIAERRGESGTVGNLLQRAAYIFADRGEYAAALRIAERATMIFIELGDQGRIGQTLIDRGLYLLNLDRMREAARAEETGIEYLEPGAHRYHFAARQHLGIIYRGLGDPETALRWIGEARELVPELGPEVGPAATGKLLWVEASILSDLERYEEAARGLRHAVKIFRNAHHGETAIVTVELVRVLLRQGRTAEAYEAAETARALVFLVDRNKIVSAALAELLRGGRAALTLDLVEHVARTLKKARERPDWRSLEAEASQS